MLTLSEEPFSVYYPVLDEKPRGTWQRAGTAVKSAEKIVSVPGGYATSNVRCRAHLLLPHSPTTSSRISLKQH